MYSVYSIEKEQAEKILKTEENFLNDVKAKEIKPAKLSETVSAFANAGGGDLYIGIAEEGINKIRKWCGYRDVEEANDLIRTLLEAHPFGNHLIFEFLSSPGKSGYVLHITVKKVKEVVKSTKGEVFVRVNAGKIKLDTDDKIKGLEFSKGVITFEDEWVNVDISRIENSLSVINFVVNIIPNSEPLTYLNNQELVRDSQAKVSGVLLFCDEPAIYLPKRCSAKVMRYKTKDEDIGREFLDDVPITVEGDIYQVIYNTVQKATQIVESIQKLGESGLEKVIYPQETLHEIITNAILHRDYRRCATFLGITNQPVKLKQVPS
jgi:ATP-dependent DNA helicase RecG